MNIPEEDVVELDVAIIGSILACSLHEVDKLVLRSDVHDDDGRFSIG